MDIFLLTPTSETWPSEIETICTLMQRTEAKGLFPPHFLKASFGKIGGQALLIKLEQKTLGIGLLFPRAIEQNKRAFTLCLYPLQAEFSLDHTQFKTKLENLPGIAHITVCPPVRPQDFIKDGIYLGEINLGRPDYEEALAITCLQEEIWGSKTNFLYPCTMHARTFRAGTSLVARIDQQPVGFLFGFYKFGGSNLPQAWQLSHQRGWRIESQLMGLLSACRGHNIGFLLKKIQAQQARQAGVDIINWTVDPLQYVNARLNLGKLRAVIFDFYPHYYDFQNQLNQVPASRFGMTWLIKSTRVQQALANPRQTTVIDLKQHNQIIRVNERWTSPRFDHQAAQIAFEVPTDWTMLQQTDRSIALQWREVTDQLFSHYIGCREGNYIITDVAEDGDRRYVVARRVSTEMLNWLGQTD